MPKIDIPADTLFGRDNLPYGVFSAAGDSPRVGVRVADYVVDLSVMLGDEVFAADTLNPFMAQGREAWDRARNRIQTAIDDDLPAEAIHSVADVQLHLPIDVADYVDFYASEHHATNLGKLFRPDQAALMPNWKHLPVGYHGRAGTVVASGTDIVRPCGQRKAADEDAPTFGPSRRLDIEAEMGFVVGANSTFGGSVQPDEFADYVFGAVIVNDWSARDIQAWEYVPLGPFLGKSFATSISPWVVPIAALESARVPTPTQDPEPLPYLRGNQDWGLNIDLKVEWNDEIVSRPPYAHMYWSPAQMLAHCTVNGATARTGDLFASGTISGPSRDQAGAFIELTWGGQEPVMVGGRERSFLQDHDTVRISASAPGANGGRIGFGDVSGTIKPANLPDR